MGNKTCHTWFSLQQLLKVENRLLVVLFPKHQISHHLQTWSREHRWSAACKKKKYWAKKGGIVKRLTSVAASLTGSFFKMTPHCCWQASTSSRVRYSCASSNITCRNRTTRKRNKSRDTLRHVSYCRIFKPHIVMQKIMKENRLFKL